ncbi:hypothetical protein EDD18DRAFT_1461578 [Armillaria luteobubalina]|uniref:Uncharacterized protein n=1 Tax=Armillaria luteobubalina TaxID=153913 RepID=A0AA39Q988_9AGAR|nr:hypothetical protein EDD18DRAFT_1461578 [Armillaria luteobubalina]
MRTAAVLIACATAGLDGHCPQRKSGMDQLRLPNRFMDKGKHDHMNIRRLVLTAIQDHSIIGNAYRVNLVQDFQSLNSVLAQSAKFNITESSSSSSSATGSSTSITRITSLIATTGTASGAFSSASSTVAAMTSNAALPVSVSRSGFMGVLALLGAMLF